MSRIHTECPQLCLQLDWPVKLVWLESSQLPVPEQWTTLEGCNQLGERGVYLLVSGEYTLAHMHICIEQYVLHILQCNVRIQMNQCMR